MKKLHKRKYMYIQVKNREGYIFKQDWEGWSVVSHGCSVDAKFEWPKLPRNSTSYVAISCVAQIQPIYS